MKVNREFNEIYFFNDYKSMFIHLLNFKLFLIKCIQIETLFYV